MTLRFPGLLIACTILLSCVRTAFCISAQAGFVYSDCTEKNNQLNFTEISGGSLYWESADKQSKLMNDTSIVNCLVLLKGRPQGTNTNYKQLFRLHFRNWIFDDNSFARSQVAPTYLNSTFQQILKVCGPNCPTGCMTLEHPTTKVVTRYCGVNRLTGTDHVEYFEENFVILRFYMLGGLYWNVSDATGNFSLQALVPAPFNSFVIDFSSFYFGKCQDLTKEYQCVRSHQCVDLDLHCDRYGGRHCSVPTNGAGSQTDDETNCSYKYVEEPNLLWAIFAIFGIPLLIYAIWWLFYRPGWLIWRCARLRNAVCCKATCCLCCVTPCVLENGPNKCGCCRNDQNEDGTIKDVSRAPTNCCKSAKLCCCAACCLPGCCPCGGGGGPCGGGAGGANGKNPNIDVVVYPKNGATDYTDYKKNDVLGWEHFINGEGLHLRECR